MYIECTHGKTLVRYVVRHCYRLSNECRSKISSMNSHFTVI